MPMYLFITADLEAEYGTTLWKFQRVVTGLKAGAE
jgi:hypothetical protein